MNFRIIEKLYPAQSITAPVATEWLDLGGQGCDSLAFVMVASAASSPGTATIVIEGSLDGVNPVTVGTPLAVSANAVYEVEKDRPAMRYYRLKYAIASGSYTSTLRVLAKGDRA